MVSKVVLSLLVASAFLFPSRSRVKDLNASIRPLAWTTDVMDMWGESVDHQEVRNHCTAWAYRTPANPTKTHWITAAHCILDEDTGAYQDRDYQINGKRVYPENWLFPQDIASLSSDVDAPGLSLAPSQGEVGDVLLIRGYPLGWKFLLTTFGHMGALSVSFPEDAEGVYYNLYVVPAAPGNSGSPVFNTHDEVLGLLQIGWGRGFSPVSGGVDLATIRVFMNLLP